MDGAETELFVRGVTVDFREGQGVEVRVLHVDLPDRETRDAVEAGWVAALERLAACSEREFAENSFDRVRACGSLWMSRLPILTSCRRDGGFVANSIGSVNRPNVVRLCRAPSSRRAGAMIASVILALGCVATPAAAQIACSYEVAAIITPAPTPPFSSPIYPTAISPNGRWVVGYYNPGLSQYSRGFWFDMNTMQFHTLPMLPGALGTAIYDVNDAGLVVGSYWIQVHPAVQRGIVFDINADTYLAELMPLPGAAWCIATGINSRNQVCGERSIGSPGDTVN